MRNVIKLRKKLPEPAKRKRVAAYARVSSDKDDQFHSLSAQISYYNSYLGGRSDWELVGIYADEGITGTKVDRPEFQRMLADCRAGKIDMVITKSITRLARNTVLLLEVIRELRERKIDVYFEKENIHTLSADGELMLTLLAAYAQEESYNASENQKWRIQKLFEQGLLHSCVMLGYRLKDGQLRIVPEEAKIVRQIFADYLAGMGKTAIARRLTAMGVPARNGRWYENTILKILSNEKYTGDMVLQKFYRRDHITKEKVINHGEKPRYIVENSHEAIIDKDTFAKVQQEIARRAQRYHPQKCTPPMYPFAGLLRCELCGGYFRRKIAAAGTKYAKPVWICQTYNTLGKKVCPSQQIPEKILLEKTTQILGTENWDRETLLEQIAEIRVPGHNRLLYVFRDGRIERFPWQNPSRRESWTEEKKQMARERQHQVMERRRNNGD